MCLLKDPSEGQILYADELMTKQWKHLWLASEIMREYRIQDVEQRDENPLLMPLANK